MEENELKNIEKELDDIFFDPTDDEGTSNNNNNRIHNYHKKNKNNTINEANAK